MVSEEHREFPESVDLAGWARTVALLLIQGLTLCMHNVDRVNTQISISQKYDNEQGIENLFRCGSSTPTLHAISILSVQFDTLIHKGQSRSLTLSRHKHRRLLGCYLDRLVLSQLQRLQSRCERRKGWTPPATNTPSSMAFTPT